MTDYQKQLFIQTTRLACDRDLYSSAGQSPQACLMPPSHGHHHHGIAAQAAAHEPQNVSILGPAATKAWSDVVGQISPNKHRGFHF